VCLIEPLKNNIAEGSEASIKVLTITKSSHNAHIEIIEFLSLENQ
jgi:hypothetical protein